MVELFRFCEPELRHRFDLLSRVRDRKTTQQRECSDFHGGSSVPNPFKLFVIPAMVVFVFTSMAVAQDAPGDQSRGRKTVWHFASKSEASDLLRTTDDFTERLSRFDRSARLKTSKTVTEQQYFQFVAGAARQWSDGEQKKLRPILDRVSNRIEQFELPIPQKINLIKTSGDEEGRAPYTRGTSIIIPVNRLDTPANRLEKMIYHELFHIASRSDSEFRDQIYSIIGFELCGELEFPKSLVNRKLTNPDAPVNQHCIQVTLDGKPSWVMPILFSKSETYDENRGGEFFDYLTFRLLVVNRDESTGKLVAPHSNEPPKLISPKEADGFFDQIGLNTGYIIHPEEILADNFSMLAIGDEKVRSPKLLQQIAKLIESK